MKILYISIPITGHPIEKVKERAERLKKELSVGGWEIITPFDVVPDKNIAHIEDPQIKYAYCMGKDIEKLLICDAVFFAEGYKDSKGCLLEHAASLIYEKMNLYESSGLQINKIYLKRELRMIQV